MTDEHQPSVVQHERDRRTMLELIVLTVLTHTAFVGARVNVTLSGIELGASPFAVGLLLAFVSLLPMVMSVSAGRQVDRIGVRAPMFWGAAVLAGGMLMPVMAFEIAALFVCSTAIGVGFMGIHVCGQKLAGELGGPEARRMNFSLMAIGFSVSAFIGPILTGLLIDSIGYRACYAVLALFPLAAIAILYKRRLADRVPPPQPVLEVQATRGSVLDLVRDPALRKLYITSGMISAAWDVHQFVVPLYGSSLGLSASVIGLLLGTFSLATFVIRLVVPYLMRRFPEWTMIYVSMWITLAAYLLYPLSDSLVLMFSLSFLLGLGLGMSQPIILSLLHRLAPPNRAGEATGLRMSLVNFTQTFLPGALGAVGGALGLGTLFWGMAIMLGGAAWFAGRNEPQPADSDQQLARNPPSVPPAPPATPAPPTTPAPPATPAPPTSAPPQ